MYGRVNGTVKSRLLKIEGTFGPQWNCLTDHSSITFVGDSGYLWSYQWNCLTMSQRSSEML